MVYDEILRPFASEDVPEGEETKETETPAEEGTEAGAEGDAPQDEEV